MTTSPNTLCSWVAPDAHNNHKNEIYIQGKGQHYIIIVVQGLIDCLAFFHKYCQDHSERPSVLYPM